MVWYGMVPVVLVTSLMVPQSDCVVSFVMVWVFPSVVFLYTPTFPILLPDRPDSSTLVVALSRGVFLDFSKAFDKVSHSRLMKALSHYKVHPVLLNWIQNYLSQRSQSTLVDGAFSSSTLVLSGVPQGSVLGPLLFSIYIQDLINTVSKECKLTTIYAFADDIKLLSTSSSDIQKALTIVQSWVDNWKLDLNSKKSEHLTIRNKNSLDLYLHHQVIPKVDKVRDLGLTLTNKLKWDSYINKTRSKCNVK